LDSPWPIIRPPVLIPLAGSLGRQGWINWTARGQSFGPRSRSRSLHRRVGTSTRRRRPRATCVAPPRATCVAPPRAASVAPPHAAPAARRARCLACHGGGGRSARHVGDVGPSHARPLGAVRAGRRVLRVRQHAAADGVPAPLAVAATDGAASLVLIHTAGGTPALVVPAFSDGAVSGRWTSACDVFKLREALAAVSHVGEAARWRRRSVGREKRRPLYRAGLALPVVRGGREPSAVTGSSGTGTHSRWGLGG